ncbi:hypothetical protein [Chryseobacterium bernardetii]|uniref:hypothetical protein n=2 Tax=Chryseobacterium group TaxID=2782232 RepID=UPI001629713A|nr:hypothetical protein [Chryseobacterium bernardetii]
MAAFIVFFLYSCRSEDLLSNNEEEYSSKFKVFSNQEKEKIDYGKGFKTLLERYDSIHNVQHTPKALKKAWKNSSAMSDEYIEFNIRSQDITTKNKEVYTLFPLIRNHQVLGIIIAVLKNEDTYVEYLKMSPEAENYDTILELFRAQYIKSTLQNKNNTSKGSGGPCGFEGAPPCDIDTIIIIVPGGGSGGGGLPPGGGGGPSGGCGPYEDCIHKPDDGGGGGGETTPTNPTNQNPCEKMKSQNSTQSFKDKVAELDKKEVFNKNEETGFAAAYGTKPYEPMVNTANDNLKFPPGNKYFGYMHTHLDSKEGVVKIFSPADVSTFLTTCVRNAQEKGTMTDAYGMVITSQGNYILKYSGDGNFGIGPGTLKSWNSWYDREYQNLLENGGLSQPDVEKLFTRFLEEKVKLDGLEVYKSDKTTGNTSKLRYDGKDNPVKPIPCP